MRLYFAFLLGLAAVGLLASQSQAGLNIDSSHSQATASITYSQSNGFSDSSTFNTNLNNNFSGAISNTKDLSEDVAGVSGQGHYNFSVGTVATNLLPSNRWNLGVSADSTYNVSSNNATLISSSEHFLATLNFTIASQSYNVDFVQVLHDLNSPVGASPNSLNLHGTLSSQGGGTIYQVNSSRDNTGASSFNSTFPSSFVLGPGSYTLQMDLTGLQSGLYNLSNVHEYGAISLSLAPIAAVPEPASLILCSCIGLAGAPRLRRWLKQRKATT